MQVVERRRLQAARLEDDGERAKGPEGVQEDEDLLEL